MPLDGASEFRIDDVVHAGRRLRLQAAKLLEAAARTRLEPPKPLLDAALDRRVVATVEMEKRRFLERAPVGPGVKSWILNFIYHSQLSLFRNSESTIMSVMGRIQLENGKTGWERSGMADGAMALF